MPESRLQIFSCLAYSIPESSSSSNSSSSYIFPRESLQCLFYVVRREGTRNVVCVQDQRCGGFFVKLEFVRISEQVGRLLRV